MADAVHPTTAGHGHDEGHGHAHGHLPFVAHHFETPAQQFDAGKLGMWLFLVQELLFFSGLFCAYAVYRANHPEIFLVGQHFLDVTMGAINTVVLIASSLTMALGVWCAQTSRRTGLIVCLILTFMGATGFMVIKYMEYTHKIHDGVIWGANFAPQRHGAAGDHGAAGHAADAGHSSVAAAAPAAVTPPAAQPAGIPAATGVKLEPSTIKGAPPGPGGLSHEVSKAKLDPHVVDPYAKAYEMRDLHIFLGIYFCLTGLHGIHVVAGMIMLIWLLIGAIKGRYNSDYYTPVDLGGLYWHVVDLVWIFLFPLLYLIH